ncbi:MAG: nucleotidyl transferase AbiEii/AbiGii toxin family protein [Acidimicrobiales bacterium]
MTGQPRRPAGTPAGGQFAEIKRPEANGVELVDDELTDDGLPGQLAAILPEDTAHAWATLAPLLPPSAYLAGGTAIAAHLYHRTSRDLDFFLAQPEDLETLHRTLTAAGPWDASTVRNDTLNGVFGATKVQFLEAAVQENVEAPTTIAGIPVASLPDLLASKLNALVTRAPAAMRDYFDLKAIEEKTTLRVEEGLGIFVRRFRPVSPRSYLVHVVRALGYMGDVEDDNLLPNGAFADVEAYWKMRQPEILRHLERTAFEA